MEIEAVDRISNLPEFILHDILSLIPRKDSARTCLLSKQWNLLWESYPVLEFKQEVYTEIPIILFSNWSTFTQQILTFLNGVKNSLVKFSKSKATGRNFELLATNCDPQSNSKALECFELALEIGVIEINIFLVKPIVASNFGLIFPDTMIVPNQLKYNPLEKLFLHGVYLSENSIRDIVRNCPNIRVLSLEDFSGLQRLRISKPEKLEVVSICSLSDVISVEIDAPKLREFDCSRLARHCAIDLSSCRVLRKLRLNGFNAKDEVFHSLISNFPLLEDLKVIGNELLRTVSVSGKNLKSVDIWSTGNEIQAIEIDAPATLVYKFESGILPRMTFKRVPARLEIFYDFWFVFDVTTSYFVNLREFLASFTRVQLLTVGAQPHTVIFDRKELRRVVDPPLSQLDELKLYFPMIKKSFYMKPLIEGLLWSSHPKRISVMLGSIVQNSCIKILWESLLENEKHHKTCCDSSHIKCWRHHLKSVRIENFGDLDWTDFLDKLMSVDAFNRVICFKLEWDDSIF